MTPQLPPIFLFFCFLLQLLISFPELESVSQKRIELCTHHWLDVVLSGDSFLQKEVGGGQKDCGSESAEPAGLPRTLLGMFQLLVNWLLSESPRSSRSFLKCYSAPLG